MTKTGSVLFASALLLTASGCFSKAVIPDPTIPHRVAKEAEVEVWLRRPDGTLSRQKVRVMPGWWVAGPPVVEVSP